ncbi:MAG: DUF3617 domain-containing protein [Sinobacteraceae bacterium]|nr:DUF3617 domain-containing protein [Nevskiaceae bacterium]
MTPMKLLGLASLVLSGACVVHAAEYVKPNIKPGLWEVTHTPQVKGQMPISEDQLAKMTPEQRQRLETAMKAGMANAAKPHVYKECMTPEKIARALDLDRGSQDSSCKRKIVASSPSELRLHDECTRPNGKSVTDVHVQIEGTTRLTGTVDVVMSSGEKTMTVNSKLGGKWLSSDCGAVKDTEVEK